MKKVLQCFVLLSALIVGGITQAQTLEDYGFSTGTNAAKWKVITDSTNLLGTGYADSRASSLQSIGFSFPFALNSYTQFSVNSDGNLRLGSTVTGTGAYSNPFSSSNSNTNSPKINFFGCDGYFLDSIHYVYSQNFITAEGVNLLVVEFCLGTYTSSTRYQKYKWQVHLYGNGNIEIVYAATAPNQAPAVANQKGLCVNSSDGLIVDNTNSVSHFTDGTTTTWSSGTWPAPGTYYTFTRPLVCESPSSITIHSLSPTTASLSFTPAGSESAWIGTITPGIMGYSELTLTDTNVNLMFLSPNTEYTVSVRALCAVGDTSRPTQTTFHTPCNPLSTPYFEDFDNTTESTTAATHEMPSCWTIGAADVTMTADQSPQIYYGTSYSHSGNYSMRLYYRGYTTLPIFQTPVDSLMLKFWLKQTSSSYQLVVGVMTNPNDPSTFVPVDTIRNSTTDYEYIEVYFDNYEGNGQFIAFHNITNTTYNYSYNYIDDLQVSLIPSCRTPQHLEANNIYTSSAVVSWTGTSPSYTVTYGPDTNNLTSISTNTVFATLTGLTPNTDYIVMVKGVCSATEESEYGLPITFRTACLPISLPYIDNFDEITDVETSTTGIMPDCWTIGAADVTMNSTQSPQLYYGSSNAHSGNYSMRLYYRGYTCLPPISTPVDSVMLKFWVKQTSSSYQLEVGVMSNPNDPATFVAIDTIDNTSTSAYEYYEVLFNNYTGSGQYIALHNITNSTYSYSYNYIDDIELTLIPNCVAPQNVSVSNIAGTSATVTWTGNAASYTVAYGTDTNDLTTISTNTNYIYIAGLQPLTNYIVIVKSVCGINDESEYTLPYSFTTACAAMPIPYFEDFDNLTNTLPDCWQKVGSGTVARYSSTTYSHSGNYSLRFSGSTSNLVLLPVMDTATNQLEMSIWTRPESFTNSSCGTFSVGYVTDADDATTFVAIETYNYTDFSSTENRTISFANVPANSRIAMRHNANATNWYWFVDDIDIHFAPACPAPTGVTVSNLASHSATISWQSTAPTFIVTYGTDSANMTSISTNTNYINLTALSSATTYYVSVKALCAIDDESSYTIPVSFTTACDSLAVPYFEDFENLTTSFPNCWTKVGTGTVAISSTYTHYPGIALRFSGSLSNLVVLPTFSTAVNQLQMTLWMRPESFTNSSCGSFQVGYVTDILDASTFVTLDSFYYADFTDYEFETINFSTAPANAHMALRHTPNSSSWYWFVDDITVETIPSYECYTVTALTVDSTTANSISLSWTDANNTNATYTVYNMSDTSVIATGLTATNYTVTGLNAATGYTFGVVANCTSSSASEFATVSATTSCLSTCQISILGEDSYGDGWNGASINIYQGSSLIGTFTLSSGSSLAATYEVCSGLPLTFRWTSGSYDSEVSFTILDGGGATVYTCNSGTSLSSESVFFTLNAPCPTCLIPTVTLDNFDNSSATISWTSANTGATYTVYRDTTIVATGLTTSSYTFTGLTGNTTYNLGVQANCSSTDASGIAYAAVHTDNDPVMCDTVPATVFSNADSATTTTNYFPGFSYYDYSYTEVIIPAERLTGLGEIKALEFKPTILAAGSSYFDDCEIYMMHTTATSLTNDFIQDTNNFQLVYTGDLSFDNTNWQLVNFDNNFVWNGVDNVLVAVLRNHGSYASSGSFEAYQADSNLARYVYRDDTPFTIGEITTTSNNYSTSTVPVYHLIGCPAATPAPVTLTVATADNTMGTTSPAPGTYTYNVGDTMQVTALPNAGYRFDYWTVSLGFYTDTIQTNPLIDVVPSYYEGVNISLIANFVLNQYTITVTSANPTLGTVTGSGTYASGATATITATPAPNCRFVQWNDGDTHAVRTVIVTGDATYTATFAYNPVTVTLVNANPDMGMTTPAPGTYTFNLGDTVSAYATAQIGHHFLYWIVNAAGITDTINTNSLSAVIPNMPIYAGQSLTVTAYFAVNQYSITVAANDDNLGTVLGGGIFNYLDTIVITAIPAQYSTFLNWDDGDTNAIRSVVVTESHTYTAIFQSLPRYEVSIDVSPSYGGTVSGAGLYYEGETVTLTATPNDGYHFEGWALEGSVDPFDFIVFSHDPTYTFTMDGYNHHYIALFEENPLPATLTVTLNHDDRGYVLINGQNTNTYEGFIDDTVHLQAVAASGYYFQSWDGIFITTDSLVNDHITLVLAEPHTQVYCYFARVTGIDNVSESNVVILSMNNNIIVRGAEQQAIRVYDLVGRMVAQRTEAGVEETIAMPTTGVYLVQVGNAPAIRVVVRH